MANRLREIRDQIFGKSTETKKGYTLYSVTPHEKKALGGADNLADAIEMLKQTATAFEDGLDEEPIVIDSKSTNYYAEYADGDWFELKIV